MTHYEHLPSILKNGLFSHNTAHSKGYIKHDISNIGVNNRRAHKIVKTSNRPIHDYVPFYFNIKNAMLYTAKDKDKIIILGINLDILLRSNVCYTNGNAAKADTSFKEDYKLLADPNFIKFPEVFKPYEKYEYNTGYFKSKRMSEILVPDFVSSKYIDRIYVRNDDFSRFIYNEFLAGTKHQHLPIIVDGSMFPSSF